MRILVLSDSHGAVEACRLAVEQSTPDQILHLGDCVRDAERLHALFPAIPLTGVPRQLRLGRRRPIPSV